MIIIHSLQCNQRAIRGSLEVSSHRRKGSILHQGQGFSRWTEEDLPWLLETKEDCGQSWREQKFGPAPRPSAPAAGCSSSFCSTNKDRKGKRRIRYCLKFVMWNYMLKPQETQYKMLFSVETTFRFIHHSWTWGGTHLMISCIVCTLHIHRLPVASLGHEIIK